MAAIKKGLGRGLSALIPDADMDFLSRVARGAVVTDAPDLKALTPKDVSHEGASPFQKASETLQEKSAKERRDEAVPVQWVDIEQIEANPFQPRRTFSPQEMQELVASISEHGILQPILVRPIGETGKDTVGTTRFQLVAGERRWRAAREAGLKQVPAVVRAVEDQQALELALIENVQRHDISPLDAAIAYKRLASEFKLSQDDIARRVGKSRSAVANTLRLLDLPSEVQSALEDGTLSEGHGRAILLAGGEGARRATFRRIVRDRLSVREAEHLARGIIEPDNTTGNDKGATAASGKKTSGISQGAAHDYAALQKELEKLLGARLSIKPRARGGQILIQYNDEADLTRLIELFK